jgi:multidrug efflux pump subunit AcrB
MAKSLPTSVAIEWAGLSYEERLADSKTIALYGTALILVFLCLAALYESWAIPFAVMMDMPLGALGVLADAALHAVRQRLRPILMTSLAFGLGVLLLALSRGAGSSSQNDTGIVGGALTTTVLGLFFVSLYFVVVMGLFRVKPLHPPRSPTPCPAPKTPHPKRKRLPIFSHARVTTRASERDHRSNTRDDFNRAMLLITT